MKASYRQELISESVLAGPVTVTELARRFAATESTIRRDLARLHEMGVLVRTHGGAVARGPVREQAFAERSDLCRPQKLAIAESAVTFVSHGDTVIVDAGTTCGLLAGMLRRFAGLTVVTGALTVVEELIDADGAELLLLGGAVRSFSRGTVGPIAEATLRKLTARVAFLGADGVVAGRGLCEAGSAQASLKELMIQQSAEVFVLADSSKLGRSPSYAWTPLDGNWTLITDSGATREQLAPFRALGNCRIIIAKAPGSEPSAAEVTVPPSRRSRDRSTPARDRRTLGRPPSRGSAR